MEVTRTRPQGGEDPAGAGGGGGALLSGAGFAGLKPAQLTTLNFPGLRALFFGGVDRTPAVCQVSGAPSGSHL